MKSEVESQNMRAKCPSAVGMVFWGLCTCPNSMQVRGSLGHPCRVCSERSLSALLVFASEILPIASSFWNPSVALQWPKGHV